MLNIEAKLEVVGKPEPRDWKNNEVLSSECGAE